MSKRRSKFPHRQKERVFLKNPNPFFLSWTNKKELGFFQGKRVILALITAFSLGSSLTYYALHQGTVLENQPIIPLPAHHATACFTPGQACLPLIQKVLETAQKTIHLQAYTFTQKCLTENLLKAMKRGVDVIVILDKSQRTARFSQYPHLKTAHIPVFFDTKPTIAHNKVIIIDQKIVITGYYNFSQAAETKNAENLLIIHSPELATLYDTNFQKRLKESKKVL